MQRDKYPYLALAVCWLCWFWNATYRFSIPIILSAVKDTLSLSASAIALGVSLSELGNGFGRLTSGYLCRWLGIKKVIALFIVSTTTFMLLFSTVLDYYPMIVLLALAGFSLGLYLPAGLSLVTEVFRRRRGLFVSIHETGISAGTTFGPVFLALAISSGLEWTGAIQAWALFALAICTLVVVVLKEPRSEEAASEHVNEGETLSDSSSVPMWVVMTLVVATMVDIARNSSSVLLPLTFINKFGLSVATSALYVGMNRLTGVASALLWGYLSDRVGRIQCLVLSGVLGSIVFICISNLPFDPVFYPVLLLASPVLSGSYLPIVYTAIGEMFPLRTRSRMLGYAMFCIFVVSSGHTIVAGWLVDNLGLQVAWSYVEAMLLLSALINLSLYQSFFRKIGKKS